MISNISEIHAEDNIAVLTIENGTKNLLCEPEFINRTELLGWLENNPQVKALIITGKGRHFSHGADVSLFNNADISCLSSKLENAVKLLHTIERLPIVTAAAINGGCFGGGLEIALSCQFRIASPSAFLGLPEVMHGVIPGMGGMERLLKLIGKEKALQMILRGDILSAADALAIGLVTQISRQKNSFDETLNFVKELIADKSKAQIQAIINTFTLALDGADEPSKGMFEAILAEGTKN